MIDLPELFSSQWALHSIWLGVSLALAGFAVAGGHRLIVWLEYLPRSAVALGVVALILTVAGDRAS